MFSQIETDMNNLIDFKLAKTSAVLLFAGLCGLAYALGGWIGLVLILAMELHRYWRGCLHETTR